MCCVAVADPESLYATTPLLEFLDGAGERVVLGRETPLHAACHLGHARCAYQLIHEYGLNVAATCASGCTPMHLAAFHGDTELMRILTAAGATMDVGDASGSTVHDYLRLGQRPFY